jgi:hypothetical protein
MLALESYMYVIHISTLKSFRNPSTALANCVMHKIYISAICST